MGEFVPARLSMQNGERPVLMNVQNSYSDKEHFVFIFENGKGVRVPASTYEVRSARRKLVGVYSDASPLVAAFYEKEPFDIMLVSDQDRAIVIKTSLIPEKSTKTSGGVTLMTLKGKQKLVGAYSSFGDIISDSKGYKKIKIPATGVLLEDKDISKQQLKMEY
jgi:DNA gyrase subunit A